MTEEELRLHLALFHLPGLGYDLYTRLLQALHSPERIRRAGPATLQALGLEREAAVRLSRQMRRDRLPWRQAEADLAWRSAHRDRHILTLTGSRDYPPLLREIESPPPLLFASGNRLALRLPQIAVVGSRYCSPGGRETAGNLAAELARRGPGICSGLAIGIDAAAHKAAVGVHRPSIAVLGSGLDRIYPETHRDLAASLQEEGLLLSEFPRDMAPRAQNFPRRNRIISGLSLATVVVEATLRSGSLITARLALEQNREVFAVPGSLRSPVARGCHRLIREGAALLESAEDLLQILGPRLARCEPPPGEDVSASPAGPSLSPEEQRVYQQVDHNPAPAERLLQRTGLDAPSLNRVLMRLELKGRIEQSVHGWQRR